LRLISPKFAIFNSPGLRTESALPLNPLNCDLLHKLFKVKYWKIKTRYYL